MELRQMRYLVALVEEQSFTGAARRMKIAQPALSQQVAKLERELGIVLVERTRRGALPTNAGQRVVARARVVLAEVDAITDEIGELTGLRAGRVAIGVTLTLGPLRIAPMLASFHHAHPKVEIALSEHLSTSLAEHLRGDALDVAFVTAITQRDRAGLELLPIASEPLVALLPPGHCLAGRRSIRVQDLRDDAFVAFPRGATIRRAIDELAAVAGFVPRVSFEVGDVGRMRALVADGLAVAILPRSDAYWDDG